MPRHSLLLFTVVLSFVAALAARVPAAEFDFARLLECRDVTPNEFAASNPDQRILEMVLRLSVRFHGADMHEVERIDVEVDGASGNLAVHDFSPTTTLASDLTEEIKRTTTTEKKHALDATLGGQLPIVAGELVAQVTPSVSGGIGRRETETVTTSRLPPKRAIITSGTTQQSRGVFFKLHQTSQTTLEGVHELVISFVVPTDWQTGTIEVRCAAHGHRRLLGLVAQHKVFGAASAPVHLYLTGSDEARQVAERRAYRDERPDDKQRCCSPAQIAEWITDPPFPMPNSGI